METLSSCRVRVIFAPVHGKYCTHLAMREWNRCDLSHGAGDAAQREGGKGCSVQCVTVHSWRHPVHPYHVVMLIDPRVFIKWVRAYDYDCERQSMCQVNKDKDVDESAASRIIKHVTLDNLYFNITCSLFNFCFTSLIASGEWEREEKRFPCGCTSRQRREASREQGESSAKDADGERNLLYVCLCVSFASS